MEDDSDYEDFIKGHLLHIEKANRGSKGVRLREEAAKYDNVDPLRGKTLGQGKAVLTQNAEDAILFKQECGCIMCGRMKDIKIMPVNTKFYGQLFTSVCNICCNQKYWYRNISSMALRLHQYRLSAKALKDRRESWNAYLKSKGFEIDDGRHSDKF